jgi:hypothetical protein
VACYRWNFTLREFAEKARRDYGIEVDTISGEMIAGPFFTRGDERYAAFPEIEEDVVLAPTVLRSLCRFYGLPPLDFGLDPDEEDP